MDLDKEPMSNLINTYHELNASIVDELEEEYLQGARNSADFSEGDDSDDFDDEDNAFPVLDPYYYVSDDEKFLALSEAGEDSYLADDEDSFAQP